MLISRPAQLNEPAKQVCLTQQLAPSVCAAEFAATPRPDPECIYCSIGHVWMLLAPSLNTEFKNKYRKNKTWNILKGFCFYSFVPWRDRNLKRFVFFFLHSSFPAIFTLLLDGSCSSATAALFLRLYTQRNPEMHGCHFYPCHCEALTEGQTPKRSWCFHLYRGRHVPPVIWTTLTKVIIVNALTETRPPKRETVRRQQTVCQGGCRSPFRGGLKALCNVTVGFFFPPLPSRATTPMSGYRWIWGKWSASRPWWPREHGR